MSATLNFGPMYQGPDHVYVCDLTANSKNSKINPTISGRNEPKECLAPSPSLRNCLQAGDASILRLVLQSVGRSRPSGPLGRAKLRATTVLKAKNSRAGVVFILAGAASITFKLWALIEEQSKYFSF